MTKRTLWLMVLGLLLFAACIPVKYTLEKLPDQQLYFGSGGGFTGAAREYLVLDNGQVFFFEIGVNRQDTFELETLAKPETRDLFKRLDSLRLHKYDFVYPGNMRYYIRETDEQIDHTIQWGDPQWQIRPDVESFFRDLAALMENRSVIDDFKEPSEKPKDPW